MNTFKALKIKDEGNFSIHDWAKKESKKAMDERERERDIYINQLELEKGRAGTWVVRCIKSKDNTILVKEDGIKER